MPDIAPKKKTTPQERIAQLVRLFGTTERGERANAWRALERTMESVGVTWSDIGNWIEHGDGKYTEEEMLEMVAAVRKEERARTPQSNGHIVLPEPLQMAEYCQQRPHRLKDDKQREFISDVYAIMLRGSGLSLGRLGYLASIYIQIGGRTQ
jgi:hypothetical protein